MTSDATPDEADAQLSALIDYESVRDSARRDGEALAAFITAFSEATGISSEEALCSLAHHYLDKVFADATPSSYTRSDTAQVEETES